MSGRSFCASKSRSEALGFDVDGREDGGMCTFSGCSKPDDEVVFSKFGIDADFCSNDWALTRWFEGSPILVLFPFSPSGRNES